jgi:hypothetical protein
VLVRTDDEVYRVDSVWLGPPRATFPWRARYVSYGLGLLTMIIVMFVQRRVGIGLDFFSVAWALVATVLIVRFLGKRIDYERPFGQVVALFRLELRGPRARTAGVGGAVRTEHVRVGPVTRQRPVRRADRKAARKAAQKATAPARAAAHARSGRPAAAPQPRPTTSGRRTAGHRGGRRGQA